MKDFYFLLFKYHQKEGNISFDWLDFVHTIFFFSFIILFFLLFYLYLLIDLFCVMYVKDLDELQISKIILYYPYFIMKHSFLIFIASFNQYFILIICIHITNYE